MANSDAHRAIVQQSNSLYRQLGLQPFLISLPLHGSTASINKKGIRDKILKNRSYVVTELNPLEANLTREMPEAVHGVETMVERLTDNDIMGFVFVVAEVLSEDDYRPVAGAVVELLDEHERSIRGMWCRRSLPDELVSLLLKVTAIRLFANAFELPTPGQRVRNSNKLISTLETTCLTFPREASDFFTTSKSFLSYTQFHPPAGPPPRCLEGTPRAVLFLREDACPSLEKVLTVNSGGSCVFLLCLVVSAFGISDWSCALCSTGNVKALGD
eukprot:GHVS01026909.1.p1 GENE.GHVS01026909.1~~GHVS01026909.1.p1  ORF type:complete len:272 (+),score=36.58 GHVS01026909.1:481-1296(+)